jgi:hypothetical protein
MGQIMQQQSTDPGQNFANYVGSFMNIGRNFGSLFGRQLQLATVGAAPLPYDYGFPLVAYDPAVLENPAYDNPYENAERATALLDGENGEAYVDWAKDCFGISFVKQETEDPDNPDAEPETLWAVEPPKANTIQTYKKLNSDDCKGANIGMNNSTLTTADGRDLSVRKAAATDNMNVISIFGMDSQLMAGACCYNCAENSQIGTKACEDIGMSNRGGGGGKGGGPGPLSKLPWISGVHTANEIDVNEAFGTWRGRPIDFLNTFSINWGAPSWSQMEEPFLMDEYSAFEAKGGSVDLSVPLVLDSYNQGTMQACANGANDASWQKFANSIVNHNMNSAQTIVRLGWEFNGDDGFVGNASNGPSFKSCYAHVSTVIRGIATDVLMDWTPMGGHGGPNLVENFFPGPEYADIIGVDWYDEYGIHDQASFDSACNNASNQGPCYYAEKAREMGIKFAVGEWGIVMNSGGDGDNPSYIEGMLNMFNDNADVLAYESYYNAAGAIEPTNKRSGIWPLGGNAGNIDAPQAGARYKEMMSDGTFPTL